MTASDALQQDWSHENMYAFPPFCLIMRSLARAQGAELILASHLWPKQAWYPDLLDLSVSLPVLFPMNPSLLLGPRGEIYPMIANQTRTISRLACMKQSLQSEGIPAEAS